MVIAAYYNGGGNAATAVLKGTTPATETRKYIQRIDKWLTEDFGKYANKPAKTREQAYEDIWNSNVPVDVKQKP